MYFDPDARPAGEVEATPLKTCRTCKLDKPKSAFANHARAKDGKRRDCRHCIDAGAVPRKSRKPETPAGKARRKTADYLARNREASRRWYWANREKALAKQRAYRARKRGDLVKPAICEAPGCRRQAQDAHHENYSMPLEVIWLCKPCHKVRHSGTDARVATFAKARRAGMAMGIESEFADLPEAW